MNLRVAFLSGWNIKAETKAKAKRLMNEPWFTSTKPVLVEDDIRSKQSKIANIVLKPIEEV